MYGSAQCRERIPIVSSCSSEIRCIDSNKELNELRFEQPTLITGFNRRVFLRTLLINGCSVWLSMTIGVKLAVINVNWSLRDCLAVFESVRAGGEWRSWKFDWTWFNSSVERRTASWLAVNTRSVSSSRSVRTGPRTWTTSQRPEYRCASFDNTPPGCVC